jgi:hypothetical protein
LFKGYQTSQALQELLAWRKAMRAEGGAGKWYDTANKKMREWLLEQMPLLINTDLKELNNSDMSTEEIHSIKVKKELGILLAKGSDQGRIG